MSILCLDIRCFVSFAYFFLSPPSSLSSSFSSWSLSRVCICLFFNSRFTSCGLLCECVRYCCCCCCCRAHNIVIADRRHVQYLPTTVWYRVERPYYIAYRIASYVKGPRSTLCSVCFSFKRTILFAFFCTQMRLADNSPYTHIV